MILSNRTINQRRLPVLLLVLIAVTWRIQSQGEWKQIREKEGIEVFIRSNPAMSFKEFRSRMTVDATLDQFLAVLYDVEALSSWGYNVKSASLVSREADSVQVYYAVAKAPFPYKNRDGVYLNRFDWNSGEKELTVEIDLLDDLIPVKENLVRMEGYGFWRVRQMDQGRLEIEFQMQMDPGGSIPAWLANMFAGDTPYFTLSGLRDAMREERYQDKRHSMIH